MKRVLLSAVIILVLTSLAFAQVKRNVYQLHTWSSTTQKAVTEVTFPYESRDLIVQNGDTDSVWIDLTGAATTCTPQTAGCMLLDGDSSIELYDFITDGINIITFVAQASPISITVAY